MNPTVFLTFLSEIWGKIEPYELQMHGQSKLDYHNRMLRRCGEDLHRRPFLPDSLSQRDMLWTQSS